MSEDNSLELYKKNEIASLEYEISKTKENNLDLIITLPIYSAAVPLLSSAAYYLGTLALSGLHPLIAGMFSFTAICSTLGAVGSISGIIEDSSIIAKNIYNNNQNKKLLTQKVEKTAGQLSTIDDTIEAGALSKADQGGELNLYNRVINDDN